MPEHPKYTTKEITRKIFIKNMTSTCCERIIQYDFSQNNINIQDLRMGYAQISFDPTRMNLDKIDEILQQSGMSLLISRERQIVEQIKIAVIELIHHMNNMDSILQKADYIVEKLNMNYRYLSKIFSKYETVTLEKFIILNKIERIKELIDSEEYTLSEIAYMMDYSSVQYLSNQFKKETGTSVTEYKQSDRSCKKPLDELY